MRLVTSEGKELARKGGFQHNRMLRSGGAWDSKAVSELCSLVKQSASAAA